LRKIRRNGVLAPASEAAASIDRVLPLPKALRQALGEGQWDPEILARYDDNSKQEFPLEVRLWRYLQTLYSDAGTRERAHAKAAVESWLAAEEKAPTYDSPSWVPFLSKSWQDMNASIDSALTVGSEWLKALLDRYEPLPHPLFV
jgi:hypothetical protein